MPYLLVDGKGVYDWLHAPKFHLLTFSNEAEPDRATSEMVESEFGGLVDQHAFPINEQVSEIFGTDQPFHVLLRPDNYISFVSAEAPFTKLQSYFRRFA
jgi:hypothetical protein